MTIKRIVSAKMEAKKSSISLGSVRYLGIFAVRFVINVKKFHVVYPKIYFFIKNNIV